MKVGSRVCSEIVKTARSFCEKRLKNLKKSIRAKKEGGRKEYESPSSFSFLIRVVRRKTMDGVLNSTQTNIIF